MSGERSEQGKRGTLLAAAGMLLLAMALHMIDGALRQRPELPVVTVTARQANYGDAYLICDICTPVVSGFADADFERELNARIEAHIAWYKAEAERYARDFAEQVRSGYMLPYDCVFSAWYEAKCTAGILSLKVTAFLDNGGTGMPHTVCYNADIAQCEMLGLDDLFIRSEYKPRINRIIDARMRQDPERYDVPFKGITADTQFFISHGRLYIAFAKYEIASGMTGEPEFEIPTQAVRDILEARFAGLFD